MGNESPDVLHLGGSNLFVSSLFEFLRQHRMDAGHEHLTTESHHAWPTTVAGRSRSLSPAAFLAVAATRAQRARKIVVHGLFCSRLLLLLASRPDLLRKTCWILWGGDLYAYRDRAHGWQRRAKEVLRRRVIRNVPQIVSATPGDGELCRQWYGIRGTYQNVFTYPTFLADRRPVPEREPGMALKVLVGNSATWSNRHSLAFARLAERDDGDMLVYCPLSYGDPAYRARVIEEGHARFGARFKPMLEHEAYETYQAFLAGIDIAVFAHDRQQAMGTIRSLLGFGKKVYMAAETTSWEHLQQLGLKAFPIDRLTLDPDFPERPDNIEIIRSVYSTERLLQGLDQVFGPIPS